MQAEGFSLLLTIKAIKAILYLERIFIGRKNMLPNSYKNRKRHSDKQSLAPVTIHVAHGRIALRGVLSSVDHNKTGDCKDGAKVIPLKTSSPFQWPAGRFKLKNEGWFCEILWAGITKGLQSQFQDGFSTTSGR